MRVLDIKEIQSRDHGQGTISFKLYLFEFFAIIVWLEVEKAMMSSYQLCNNIGQS